MIFLKRYQNELIVLFSFLLLLSAIGYKQSKVSSRTEMTRSLKASAQEFKELLVLKKRWVNKNTGKKVDKLQSIAPASKVIWQKKGKKLSVRYKDLSAKELNKISSTLLNLGVQIELINLHQENGSYTLELKCKW